MNNKTGTFLSGSVISMLGALIGLGGAEFRLPLLIGMFRFAALEAVILNKAMSLVVVASALPFRAQTVPLVEVVAQWPIIVKLLGGGLLGAWFGAGWAIQLRSESLYQVIAVLLVLIAVVLLLGHNETVGAPFFGGTLLAAIGVFAGFAIGVHRGRFFCVKIVVRCLARVTLTRKFCRA